MDDSDHVDLGIGPIGRIIPIVSAERCQWQEALTGFERLRNQAWTTQTPINCFLVGFHISGLPNCSFDSVSIHLLLLSFFFPNVGPLLVGSGKCRELWCCNGCYIQETRAQSLWLDRWQLTQSLFEKLSLRQIRRSVIIFNTMSSAAVRRQQWEISLCLLGQLTRKKVVLF